VEILLAAAVDIRTSDAPFLLAAALGRLGHRVSLLPVDSDLPRGAEAGLRQGGYDDALYRHSFQRHTRRLAAHLKPDVLLIYGSNWAISPKTLTYCQSQLGMVVSLWEVNQRIFNGTNRDQVRSLPIYDHIFCLDSYYVPAYRASGLRCVEHLCAAADPEEHRRYKVTADEELRYTADLSFIGTHHPNREIALATLAPVVPKVRIYGYRWGDAKPPVSDWVEAEPAYGRKKAVIYALSRLSFHTRGPHMIDGENFRVFEVASCGGVTVASPTPDLEKCFRVGEEVLVYRSLDELPRVVSQALSDPDRLSSMGQAAMRRVHAEHTYDIRAATIIDHLEGCSHRAARASARGRRSTQSP
jgi:spore maturation protein CgeB